jgi:hypothetical protein
MTVFSDNSMGTGIQADLGTTDDATINATILVVSSDDDAVNGAGSGHHVTVLGGVAGQKDGIQLGDDDTVDTNEHVQVGVDGFVYGEDNGINMVGAGSSVFNAGIIRGGVVGLFIAKQTGGETHVNNLGKIVGSASAITLIGGTDGYFIHNTGLIKATQDGASAINSVSVGATAITVTNDGRIIGNVDLGQDADVYNGTKGSVAGHINGFDGNDKLTGGKLADIIAGGRGADTMTGHGGADHFIFDSKDDSAPTPLGRDLIADFSHSQHDKIDLHAIDADETGGVDEDFSFIKTDNFSNTAGELRYAVLKGETQVAGDTDGDGVADFRIQFDGKIHFVGSDFVL